MGHNMERINMTVDEQNQIREKYYSEAVRYIDNARECLKNAKKEGNYYNDPKYVKMACGTAYSGVLVALDGFSILYGIHTSNSKKERKSIEYYQKNIGKIDRKMLNTLNGAYQILHLSGYYDGTNVVDVVQAGFAEANKIIEKIKPAGLD
jgi:uncharacterized protein (UPF0332 family)